MSLEALAVDDRGTRVIVLGAGHPHLLEGREICIDGCEDPEPPPEPLTDRRLDATAAVRV